MFSSELLLRISKEVGAPVARVETTIKLLEEGATVPFIARYRKEATGNLEDVKVRDIDEQRQRSEEHTSELQSQSNLVCRLLLEKKKKMTSHQQLRIHRIS